MNTTPSLRRLAVASLLAASFAGFATQAHAQPAASASAGGMNPMNTGALAAVDRKFIDNAAIGGMAEVALGKMAQEKAQSDAVKQFAAHMVEDHGKANAELMQLASAKGVTPPAELDKRHKQKADQLAKLSGAKFDQAYMQAMVADHKETVTLFQKQTSTGANEELKAWAAKTLPTLQEHLKMAQNGYAVTRGKTAASAAR